MLTASPTINRELCLEVFNPTWDRRILDFHLIFTPAPLRAQIAFNTSAASSQPSSGEFRVEQMAKA
jgi:hypothetical protein